MKKFFTFLSLAFFSISIIFAQAPKKPSSGDIYESIQKLNFFPLLYHQILFEK